MSDEEDTYEVTKDSVLYLIDASKAMEASEALIAAIQAASWAIRESTREGVSRNDAGVIVYNASRGDSKRAAHVLLSLSEPKIDELKRLIRLSRDIATFKQEFAPLDAQGASLTAALRLANSEMNHLHTRSLRRVILITNDDNPMRSEASNSQATLALNLASDLTGSPAFMVPIFLKTPTFDVNKFWINVRYMPPPMLSSTKSAYAEDMYLNKKLLEPWDVSALANPKHALILAKSRRKYVAFKGVLVLAKLRIGVRGYNVVNFHPRTQPIKVAPVTDKDGKQSLQMLVTERVLAYADSGGRVGSEEKDAQKNFKIGSATRNEEDWIVPVDEDELQQIKAVRLPDGEAPAFPTMYVHGFVKSADVDHEAILGHSTFIAPSNDVYTQAWPAFAALRNSMRRKQVVARVTFYPSNSAKRVSAQVCGLLYAFDPVLGENPRPNTDSGMYFVHSPYANDVRRNPRAPETVDVAPQLEADMQTLCRRFILPTGFNPQRFENPSTKQFAEIFEHHALSIPLSTSALEGKDATRPRYEKIAKTASAVSRSIEKQLNAISAAPVAAEPSPKRMKIKAEPVGLAVMDAHKNANLNRFTIAELKSYISAYEPPTGKKKADLIEQLEQIITEKVLKQET